ncbi:MAG: hypothetical protein HYU64_18525 [Armatimonadetes bacterium]|nr:hypothetical protein [Armatimonadota bacterium]
MSCTPIEVFLDEYLGKEKKDLENLLRRLSNKQTKLKTSFKCGGIPGILESVAALLEEGPGASEVYRKILSAVEGYPLTTYLEQGFDGPFRNALQEEGIPVRGEFPKYEIFPFVVKIVPKEGVALVNKKKSQGLRLSNLVGIIKKERERFFKSSFRAEEFLTDLAGAYNYLLRVGQEKTEL